MAIKIYGIECQTEVAGAEFTLYFADQARAEENAELQAEDEDLISVLLFEGYVPLEEGTPLTIAMLVGILNGNYTLELQKVIKVYKEVE